MSEEIVAELDTLSETLDNEELDAAEDSLENLQELYYRILSILTGYAAFKIRINRK